MKIKDLIAKLEALYNTYDDEYKEVMGGPEIMIDIFKLSKSNHSSSFYREYAGFSNQIVIGKSADGVYDILSAFYEDHNKTKEGQKRLGSPCPWPQSWEA